jgi:hypothetical membrane protein
MRIFLRRNYAIFGLVGAGLVGLCSLITALFYTGPDGESYSILNHFISELGEIGVSPLARLFNLGLILGGLLFIPFSLGLGLRLPGGLAKLGMIAGLVAAVSLSGVGIFPMNNLPPHITAAMTYFRSGLATVALFGLAIQIQSRDSRVIDKRANWFSLIAALCYLSFIIYTSSVLVTEGNEALGTNFRSGRPAIWPLAVLEWSIFFSTIAWFGVIALASEMKTEFSKRGRNIVPEKDN